MGFATGDYPVALLTGLAINGTIHVPYQLDRALFHPLLEQLSRDWLHLGPEMTCSLLEHVLGALLACSRIFGFLQCPLPPGSPWGAW